VSSSPTPISTSLSILGWMINFQHAFSLRAQSQDANRLIEDIHQMVGSTSFDSASNSITSNSSSIGSSSSGDKSNSKTAFPAKGSSKNEETIESKEGTRTSQHKHATNLEYSHAKANNSNHPIRKSQQSKDAPTKPNTIATTLL